MLGCIFSIYMYGIVPPPLFDSCDKINVKREVQETRLRGAK